MMMMMMMRNKNYKKGQSLNISKMIWWNDDMKCGRSFFDLVCHGSPSKFLSFDLSLSPYLPPFPGTNFFFFLKHINCVWWFVFWILFSFVISINVCVNDLHYLFFFSLSFYLSLSLPASLSLSFLFCFITLKFWMVVKI